MAASGFAAKNRELVFNESPAAADEDGREAGETCVLLLASASRRTSESEAVRQHAENDRGGAAAGRLANQERKQTSSWKPSSGGSVTGEADWGGQNLGNGSAERPNRAALPPQRGQSDLRLTRRGKRARFSGKGNLKLEIPV